MIRTEADIQNAITTNHVVQRNILELLEIEDANTSFIPEDKYLNGMLADFTIIHDDKIEVIMECKGPEIGVTDYVRGIGQTLQYEYWHDINLNKGYDYSDKFKTVLLFPETITLNQNFNISNFKYPKSTTLLEFNTNNGFVRVIDEKFLQSTNDNNIVQLCPYYVRDNRLFELYMLLKYILNKQTQGTDSIKRKEAEENDLTKTGTINNGNWRNAWISLSSLGLIDRQNLLTQSGIICATGSYEDFLILIYKDYIKPYINELEEVLEKTQNNSINLSDINEIIKHKHQEKDVLFLTQSNNRYLSSWLGIMRDDYGIIDYNSNHQNRKYTINYKAKELNEETLISKIKGKSKAYHHIEKMNLLLQGKL